MSQTVEEHVFLRLGFEQIRSSKMDKRTHICKTLTERIFGLTILLQFLKSVLQYTCKFLFYT